MQRRCAPALAALFLPLIAGPGLAADPDPACRDARPAAGQEIPVAEVLDGATVRLSDGRIVRLSGLLPPLAPLDLAPGSPWPQGAAARKALVELLTRNSVRLMDVSEAPDRHGRLSARLYGPDGTWIGGALVEAGHLILAPAGGGACRGTLLALEDAARAAGRGIWAPPTPYFALAEDRELIEHIGRYMVVEGRVRSIGTGRSVTFLNFGDDWSKDFTVLLYSSGRGDRQQRTGNRFQVSVFACVAGWNRAAERLFV